MGCSASVKLAEEKTECLRAENNVIFSDRFGESDIVIREKEQEIIKDQWKQLSSDIIGNGTEVFVNIFKAYPEAKRLFHCEHVAERNLHKSIAVQRQGVRFMRSIGRVVENISDWNNSVSKACIALGKRHYSYEGFKPLYFEAYYNAFLKMYEQAIGSNYSDESGIAWSNLLLYILEKLKKGYHLASIETVTESAIRKASEIEQKILNRNMVVRP